MIQRVIYAAALLLIGAAAQAAEDGPYISPTNERVRLTLGVLRSSVTSTLRLDSSAGVPGTTVNGEDDFGLDRGKYGPKFQAVLRVEERHRLRFDYFSLNRNGMNTIDHAITFKDVELLAGDPVTSDLNLQNFGITYGYSFLHREKFEIAGTLGINIIEISARAKVELPTRRVDERQDLAGPFPTLGIDATYVISKRFYLDGRYQYLKLSIDQLDGSLALYEFDALYRWRANVSGGIGYSGIHAKLSSTKPGQSGLFDLNAKGPQLFVRVAF
jgi:Outer membrane protein beta-barrel domain